MTFLADEAVPLPISPINKHVCDLALSAQVPVLGGMSPTFLESKGTGIEIHR